MLRLSVCTVIFCLSCNEGLDPQHLVKDQRILAMRATAPEILVTDPVGITMQFEALVVNPTKEPIQITWQFCPVESNLACLDYESLRDKTSDFMTSLDQMHNIKSSFESTPETQNYLEALPRYMIQPFQVNTDTSLYVYHLVTSGFGFGAGAWPSAVLSATSVESSILAQKRVVINLENPRLIAEQLIGEFGYHLCEPGVKPGEDATCLALNERIANTNPVLEKVQIARGKSALTPFEELPAELVVAPEEKIRILPIFTSASYETYEKIKGDLQNRNLHTELASEELSVTWYCSSGELQDDLTWRKTTLTLDTVYTAPRVDELPADSKVSIWMVANDQRGGVSWQALQLVVRE